MTWSAFDEDLRFCASCAEYVRYLRAPGNCYCVECGGEAQLMSDAEMKELRREVKGRSGQDRSEPGSAWRREERSRAAGD